MARRTATTAAAAQLMAAAQSQAEQQQKRQAAEELSRRQQLQQQQSALRLHQREELAAMAAGANTRPSYYSYTGAATGGAAAAGGNSSGTASSSGSSGTGLEYRRSSSLTGDSMRTPLLTDEKEMELQQTPSSSSTASVSASASSQSGSFRLAAAKPPIVPTNKTSVNSDKSNSSSELKLEVTPDIIGSGHDVLSGQVDDDIEIDPNEDPNDPNSETQRRLHFKSDQNYSWDYCLVFKVGDPKKHVKAGKVKYTEGELFSMLMASALRALYEARLHTFLYRNAKKDVVYCLVGASESRLEEEADRINYDVKLHAGMLIKHGLEGQLRLAKAVRAGEIEETEFYDMFGRFDRFEDKHAERSEMYLRYLDQVGYGPDRQKGAFHPNSVFKFVDRLKLTLSILEADKAVGGANLPHGFALHSDRHPLIALYPLHETAPREKIVVIFTSSSLGYFGIPHLCGTLSYVIPTVQLYSDWFTWGSFINQPLDSIRAYFGESIAMYFAFTGYYNYWLIVPALVGLAFFILQMVHGTVDVPGLAVLGIGMALWATIFLEYWKRKQYEFKLQWGQGNFLETEQPRPEFTGNWQRSLIDGRYMQTFPWHQKLLRVMFSQSVVWTLIGVVIAGVVGIFILRNVLMAWSSTYGSTMTSVLNAVQIQILNAVYSVVSRKLNDFENHRTRTEYENALITKNFLFKFVNSYNSLFYIAFLKRYDWGVGGCPAGGCLAELQTQLATIFIIDILVSNAIEIGTPFFDRCKAYCFATSKDANGDVIPLSPAELDFLLDDYESTFDDFDEMVIQYGYVCLFVVAFPLSPLLALLNNFFEVRLDGMKLCRLTRRPMPEGAEDIGSWMSVLNVMSYFAVLTNMGICVFESTQLDFITDDPYKKAFVFLALEHIIILAKVSVSYLIPDVSEPMALKSARQKYLVEVLINGMEEETDADVDMKKFKISSHIENKFVVDVESLPVTMPFSAHAVI